MIFITISRQTGSRGEEIAKLLAEKLALPIINRDFVMEHWFPEIAGDHELHMLAESPGFYLTHTSQGPTFAEYLEEKLENYIAEQAAVIYGLGSQIIFSRHPAALHIKIIASHEVRTNRIMQSHNLSRKDAETFLKITDRKHRRYISTIYDKDWSDPLLYHLILNTDFLSIEEASSLLYHMAKNKQITEDSSVEHPEQPGEKTVVFKHPSEEEFAKILDMYELEWEYEPRTFPIKWDAEGNITLAFSPDFYLPKFDTYIELTTMNQKYTSEKKKKVKLLEKLYPGTNIKIVFKNDFHALIKRFGLREVIDNK